MQVGDMGGTDKEDDLFDAWLRVRDDLEYFSVVCAGRENGEVVSRPKRGKT